MVREPASIWCVPAQGTDTHAILLNAPTNVLKAIAGSTRRRCIRPHPGYARTRNAQTVLTHYEKQTEDEAVAEDEAASEHQDQTVMEIPKELVPAVPALICSASNTDLRHA